MNDTCSIDFYKNILPGWRGETGSNIFASMELGSVRRVCLVVSNLVPPTLRVTTLFRDETAAGGLLGSGFTDIVTRLMETLILH